MRQITPSEIKGRLAAPPSKSVTIRALAAAFLCRGVSTIINPSLCNDALSAFGIIENLGGEVDRQGVEVTVKGSGGPSETPPPERIQCGESGLCMRMFTPIAALSGMPVTVEGRGSLTSRPMRMLEQISAFGAVCETTGGCAPLTIGGKLRGGNVEIDGQESSQFLTGLLMALPLCESPSVLRVSGLASRPYVALTLELLKQYAVEVSRDEEYRTFFVAGGQQYRPCRFTVEGDWSGAAFLMVAAAIAGSISVTGLSPESPQADRAILEALVLANARVETRGDCVYVEHDRLKAFDFDATDCPDLVPPLVALAAHCEGKSTVYGTQRLFHKESNRATALFSEFSKLGIAIEIVGDRMDICGGAVKGGAVDSHNDHRIAMACAVAGLRARGTVTIRDVGAVAKSYPSFFADFDSVRGER
jgi:3-phosphoshikimate 1-carboxyvinyltransferase